MDNGLTVVKIELAKKQMDTQKELIQSLVEMSESVDEHATDVFDKVVNVKQLSEKTNILSIQGKERFLPYIYTVISF